MKRIPLWVKIVCTLFLALWVPLYWQYYGPQNFLWFCDLANFLIVLALWLESPLLLSSQAVSILFIQSLWGIDVLGKLIMGFHPIGGTEYMFNPAIPDKIRFFSLFHVITPPLVLWAIGRSGYSRRGWIFQTCIAWCILPVCFVFTSPERNINWVRGLFGKPQTLTDPLFYFIFLMAGYPLFIYFPAHLLLRHLFPEKTKNLLK
jgi:hypothetical protein